MEINSECNTLLINIVISSTSIIIIIVIIIIVVVIIIIIIIISVLFFDITAIRVLPRNCRNSSLFTLTCYNSPSARCVSAANFA